MHAWGHEILPYAELLTSTRVGPTAPMPTLFIGVNHKPPVISGSYKLINLTANIIILDWK